MSMHLPTLHDAKSQAKRLRSQLAETGTQISHSRGLELLAAQYGYADWNTLHAAIGQAAPNPYELGATVTGRYLGQPFRATIHSVTQAKPGWVKLVLDLETPVDVVTFDSFSNFRRRIRGMVGPEGRSHEKTSDGTPHLELDI